MTVTAARGAQRRSRAVGYEGRLPLDEACVNAWILYFQNKEMFKVVFFCARELIGQHEVFQATDQ